MELPQPRVALGQALRGVAHSAIDLSDGLLGDLGHVLKASGVGATLDEALLPCSAAVAALDEPWRRLCVLQGGDDYELLFTAPSAHDGAVLAAAAAAGVAVTAIGHIDVAPGLRLRDRQGHIASLPPQGFDHFSSVASTPVP